MNDLEPISDFFQKSGFVWKFADGTRVPSHDEITEVVLKAIEVLSDQPDKTQVEVGRLVIQRNGSWYDLYCHMAQIPVE